MQKSHGCIQSKLTDRRIIAGIMCFLIIPITSLVVLAQEKFDSKSTQKDGAFAPTQNTTLDLPPDGIFNFTTINVPQNVTITFNKNARNTPVIMLASGNVTIAGIISVSGKGRNGRYGGEGGPGGFRGGDGGHFLIDRNGKNGEGPGAGKGGTSNQGATSAGHATPGSGFAQGLGGALYGAKTVIPLIGGSGGGGGYAPEFGFGNGGNGGGGAILIASSETINITGAIYADGGVFDQGVIGGSGGAIRLVATTIIGKPILSVSDAPGFFFGPRGGSGYIRVEAFNLRDFDQTSSTTNITLGKPNPAIPTNVPDLQILSIAGQKAPDVPNGSFYRDADITLPANTTNPVMVQLSAKNIPVGRTLKVRVLPESGNPVEVESTALAGTDAASTASAQISIPPTGISLIVVSTTLEIPLLGITPFYIDGERVSRMEIASAYGGSSHITYITESGRRLR